MNIAAMRSYFSSEDGRLKATTTYQMDRYDAILGDMAGDVVPAHYLRREYRIQDMVTAVVAKT